MDKRSKEKAAAEVQAQGRPKWIRFEIISDQNEEALRRMLNSKGLDRADLYLILSTIRIRAGLEDTFESCYPELASRYGWTEVQ